jgi:hypothetical protein
MVAVYILPSLSACCVTSRHHSLPPPPPAPTQCVLTVLSHVMVMFLLEKDLNNEETAHLALLIFKSI